jgi:Cof subfamily protein (haloacid dehalogenase superfamily)
MQQKHARLVKAQALEPQKIRALAIDLDGTLLRSGAFLSERTIHTLKACLDRHIKVIICTGRSLESTEPFRAAIGAEGPMVYFNGAEVIAMPERKILHTALLDLEVVDYCVDLSRSMGVYYQAYFPGIPAYPQEALITEHPAEEDRLYHEHTGIQAIYRDLKRILASPGLKGCIKGMFITDSETHEHIRQQLLERFGPRICVVRSSKTFLEILDAGASKGRGLQWVLEHYGSEYAQVMAFGDEENDLSLFDQADISVAPANAKAQVLEAADLVIGSHDEDGVAAFLEDLFSLGKQDSLKEG